MSLLRNRNYLLLRSAWSISSFGTKVQSFAFSLYILAVTGSVMQFTVTLCMQILPCILFAPFSGYVADRFNRKTLVIVYDSLSTVVVLALMFVYQLTGRLPVLLIYSCVFILSGIDAFFSSTAVCLMQASVEPADYVKQKSVDTTIASLISILVPAVSGMLYGFFGLMSVLLINMLSFLVSTLLESMIHLPFYRSAALPVSGGSFLVSMKDGLQYIRKNRFILSFLLILAPLNFILPGVDIGLMTISQELMHLNSVEIGLENSAISVGALAGAAACAALNKKMKKIRLVTIISTDIFATCAAFVLIGVWLKTFYVLFPPAANVLLFVLLNLIIVIANEFLSINLSAQFQRNVSNELMGRTSSFVNAALLISTPLGEIISGFMLGEFPYCVTYFAEGGLCVLLLVSCIANRKMCYNDCDTEKSAA